VKVRFILNKLDDVRYNHLKANLEFFKWELVLSAKKLVEIARNSRMLKVMKLSKNVRLLSQVLQEHGETVVKQTKSFVDYRVWNDENKTCFEVYVNDAYFELKEVLSKNPVARKIGGKIYSVKDFVDAMSKEVKKDYSKDFRVEIIEEEKNEE